MSERTQIDESYKLQGFTRWDNQEDYLTGARFTKHGIVEIYSQGHSGEHFELSRFDFVYKGRHYMRNFNKAFGKKGLARKATEFADDVVGA